MITSILCTLAVITCNPPVPKIEYHTVTAYNLVKEQTDDRPCEGATGENLCEALENGESICAANFVPFNTILQIDGYGACRVADRMASKHSNRVDILYLVPP